MTEPEAPDEAEGEPARAPFRQETWRTIEARLGLATAAPSPGAGRRWLGSLEGELAEDTAAAALLRELAGRADDPRPRLVLTGDYSSGKP